AWPCRGISWKRYKVLPRNALARRDARRRIKNGKSAVNVTGLNEGHSEASSGGAGSGLASLLRPTRPLPTCRSRMPLRRNPNTDAAIIAAGLSRGDGTSLPHLDGAKRKGGKRTRRDGSPPPPRRQIFRVSRPRRVPGGGCV